MDASDYKFDAIDVRDNRIVHSYINNALSFAINVTKLMASFFGILIL